LIGSSTASRKSPATYAVAILIDLLAGLLFILIVLVAITGGFTFTLLGRVVRVTTTGNPILFVSTLGFFRYCCLRAVPFFGVSRWAPSHWDDLATSFLARVNSRHDQPSRPLLILTLGLSVALRLVNAWSHPGFITGDDVEIHEMTVGHLLGRPWPVWNLRSAFFPMMLVYPFQAAASSIAGSDPKWLVFAGRLGVVSFATVSIWLTYRVAARLTGSQRAGLLAAVFLAGSRLHLWFGSSELPRPVASAFILAAFLLLVGRRGTGRAAMAGVLLGAGGALRFGELLFFVPACVHLLVERRSRELVVVVGTGIAAAALCVGIADWLYWGQPFSSLVHIIQYTVVEGSSSRGFQPAWYYLAHATDWTNWAFVALALFMMKRIDWRLSLWTWLPILLLSLLPHKEARYVIAVLPFLCIAVASCVADPTAFPRTSVRTLAVFALAMAVLFEMSNWQFRRSDDAVALAQQINRLRPTGVAVQQLWRFGGPIYFVDVRGPVANVDEPISADTITSPDLQVIVMFRSSVPPQMQDDLSRRGYQIAQRLSTQRYLTFLRVH
jgi:hypothetical protein